MRKGYTGRKRRKGHVGYARGKERRGNMYGKSVENEQREGVVGRKRWIRY